jgi:hypothetical protein
VFRISKLSQLVANSNRVLFIKELSTFILYSLSRIETNSLKSFLIATSSGETGNYFLFSSTFF